MGCCAILGCTLDRGVPMVVQEEPVAQREVVGPRETEARRQLAAPQQAAASREVAALQRAAASRQVAERGALREVAEPGARRQPEALSRRAEQPDPSARLGTVARKIPAQTVLGAVQPWGALWDLAQLARRRQAAAAPLAEAAEPAIPASC